MKDSLVPGGSKHRLLIVSYLFPPAGGIAVQRALSMAKYLPRNGFEVHVLKARNIAGPVEDPGLLRHVPEETRVHSAFAPEIPFVLRQKVWKKLAGGGSPDAEKAAQAGLTPWWKRLVRASARRLLCPEPEILWVPFATRAAERLIRRFEIDSVLVTAPPFSALLVGCELKKRFPGLRFISDFRDEWLSFYLKDFDFQGSQHTRRRAEQIERDVVEQSDVVVAVTGTSRDEIRGRYPGQPGGKFVLVPNGYDPEAFEGFRPRRHSTGRTVVTHVGTVYKTASPRYYLDALDDMPEDQRSQIETRFIGRISEQEADALAGRRSSIRMVGFLPQAEALKEMEETDYLLLTMTNEISLPGKLFEYLATAKPILAITHRGSEVARILEETGAGWWAEPGDKAGIQAMLARAIDAGRSGRQWEIRRELIERYERPRLAAEYGRIIRGRNELPCSLIVAEKLFQAR